MTRIASRRTPLPPRRPQEGLALGVCAGLGQRWGAHPGLLRASFVLLTLAWGAGAVVYLAFAMLMPGRGGSRATVAEALAQNRVRLGTWREGEVAMTAARVRHEPSAWAWVLIAAGALLVGSATGLTASLGFSGWLGAGCLAAGCAIGWRAWTKA